MLRKKLPDVGGIVKSKKYGTLWKIVDEKKVWQNTNDDPDTGDPRVIPAIDISYCRLKEGGIVDISKRMHFQYTLFDNTFESNWEVIK